MNEATEGISEVQPVDAQAVVETMRPKKPGIHRRLYDWVLKWADTPYGTPALAVNSFAASSFFPVPPDVLLIALTLSKPKRWLYYSSITSVSSVLGAFLGYAIGYAFLEVIGLRMLELYGYTETFETLKAEFVHYQFWAVFIAALTPIPYKVFTITCGAVNMALPVFAIASITGRAIRFIAVAALVRIFGPPVKKIIDKYFNLATILFVVILILGFLLVKVIW